ncbi:MAG: DUF4296 domain-containing protein [Phaeodactylibacter sp.]|nr:DUF4296 domain-containing protein [Phaeodactylibacter sp.]MCB9274699.1 DUF4296 domain-containing protein [Lewinellaceae bacterium]
MVLVCCAALSFWGCGHKQAALPIEEGKLVSVLIDVHLAEAAAQNLRGHTKDSILDMYYEQIFKIHGLDQATFESTMLSIRENPERLEAVYAEVMKEMERREAGL